MSLSEWQPIETAPKDGTPFLGVINPGNRGHRIVIAKWEPNRFHAKPRPFFTNCDERLFGIAWARANQPTHWMPLPEPPGE